MTFKDQEKNLVYQAQDPQSNIYESPESSYDLGYDILKGTGVSTSFMDAKKDFRGDETKKIIAKYPEKAELIKNYYKFRDAPQSTPLMQGMAAQSAELDARYQTQRQETEKQFRELIKDDPEFSIEGQEERYKKLYADTYEPMIKQADKIEGFWDTAQYVSGMLVAGITDPAVLASLPFSLAANSGRAVVGASYGVALRANAMHAMKIELGIATLSELFIQQQVYKLEESVVNDARGFKAPTIWGSVKQGLIGVSIGTVASGGFSAIGDYAQMGFKGRGNFELSESIASYKHANKKAGELDADLDVDAMLDVMKRSKDGGDIDEDVFMEAYDLILSSPVPNIQKHADDLAQAEIDINSKGYADLPEEDFTANPADAQVGHMMSIEADDGTVKIGDVIAADETTITVKVGDKEIILPRQTGETEGFRAVPTEIIKVPEVKSPSEFTPPEEVATKQTPEGTLTPEEQLIQKHAQSDYEDVVDARNNELNLDALEKSLFEEVTDPTPEATKYTTKGAEDGLIIDPRNADAVADNIEANIGKEAADEYRAAYKAAQDKKLKDYEEKKAASIEETIKSKKTKPLPKLMQQKKEAAEIPVGGSEDEARAAVNKLSEPNQDPDAQYKNMTAAERKQLEELDAEAKTIEAELNKKEKVNRTEEEFKRIYTNRLGDFDTNFKENLDVDYQNKLDLIDEAVEANELKEGFDVKAYKDDLKKFYDEWKNEVDEDLFYAMEQGWIQPSPEYKKMSLSEKQRMANKNKYNIDSDSQIMNPEEAAARSAEAMNMFAKGGPELFGGTVAGIEEDENGNITFNPAMFVAGMLLGHTAKKLALSPKFAKLSSTAKKELLNSLERKAQDLVDKYPFLNPAQNIIDNLAPYHFKDAKITPERINKALASKSEKKLTDEARIIYKKLANTLDTMEQLFIPDKPSFTPQEAKSFLNKLTDDINPAQKPVETPPAQTKPINKPQNEESFKRKMADIQEQQENKILEKILNKHSADEDMQDELLNNIQDYILDGKIDKIPSNLQTEVRAYKDLVNPDTAPTKIKPVNDLIATHNLTEENLKFAEKMGGIAAPSIAISKVDQLLSGFGEITLIGDKGITTPSKDTKVFGADIYSPRYPDVSYDVTPKTNRQIETDLKTNMAAVGEDYIDIRSISDLKENIAFKHSFLESKGIKPKIIKTTPKKASLDKYKPIFKEYLTPKAKTIDPFDMQADATFQKQVLELFEGRGKDLGLGNPLGDGASDKMLNIARSIAGDIKELQRQISNKGQTDYFKTKREIGNQISDKPKLNKEYNQYTQEYFASLDIKEQIWNGTDAQGRNKYIPHTLENVVKKMKKDIRGGESFNYGTGSIRAHLTPEFKTINQIKANKNKLVTSEEFDKVKDESGVAFQSLMQNLKQYYEYDSRSFTYSDTVSDMLGDMKNGDIEGQLKEYGFNNLDDEVTQELVNMLQALRDMPTEYFETKIIRAVDAGEFKEAVVPLSTSQSTIDLLKKKGLKVTKYNPKIDGSRDEVIKNRATKGKLLFLHPAAMAGAVAAAAVVGSTQTEGNI